MDLDRLWKVLDSVQAQIRVFDAKAQIVIAIDGVLAGFFGSQTIKIAELLASQHGTASSVCLVTTLFLCIGLLVISLMLAVSTVHPRLHLDQPHSRLFFAHICSEFKRDYVRAGQVLSSISNDELSADLASQILANSIICETKAKRFKHALLSMSGAVLVWIAILFFQFIVQEEAVLRAHQPDSNPKVGQTLGSRTGEVPAVQNNYFCQPTKAMTGGRNP